MKSAVSAAITGALTLALLRYFVPTMPWESAVFAAIASAAGFLFLEYRRKRK